MASREFLALAVLALIRSSRALVLESTSPPALSEVFGSCYGFECMRRYVDYEDGVYEWHHVRTKRQYRGVVHELRLTSVRWSLARPAIWHHNLLICVPDPEPDGRSAGWATLFLHDTDGADVPESVCRFAWLTGAVAVHLSDIPNGDVDIIGNRSHESDEEYVRAKSWRLYADHPRHPEYPVEMAATKATSRAMDAVEDYSANSGAMTVPVKSFIVVGASKRGILAYTTCAVDQPRVKAVVPQIAFLRLGRLGLAPRPNFPGREEAVSKPSGRLLYLQPDRNGGMEKMMAYKSLRSKGFMMDAYDTLESGKVVSADGSTSIYDDVGVNDLDAATARRVYSIVDPYWYIEKMTCGPILVQSVAGDGWMPADTARLYYADVPNASYQMYGPGLHVPMIDVHMETVQSFVVGTMQGLERPKIEWSIDLDDGSIDAQLASDHRPSKVSAWRGTGDCRGMYGEWVETELRANDSEASGRWHVHHTKNDNEACVAYYLSFEYMWPPPRCANVASCPQHIYRISTEVSVMPNKLVRTCLYMNQMVDLLHPERPPSENNPLVYLQQRMRD